MGTLQTMFDTDKRLAIVPNSGPVIRPTTKAQYGQAWGDAEAQAYYAALKQRFHAETLPAAAKGTSATAAN